jgi:hypothetical protein
MAGRVRLTNIAKLFNGMFLQRYLVLVNQVFFKDLFLSQKRNNFNSAIFWSISFVPSKCKFIDCETLNRREDNCLPVYDHFYYVKVSILSRTNVQSYFFKSSNTVIFFIVAMLAMWFWMRQTGC